MHLSRGKKMRRIQSIFFIIEAAGAKLVIVVTFIDDFAHCV